MSVVEIVSEWKSLIDCKRRKNRQMWHVTCLHKSPLLLQPLCNKTAHPEVLFIAHQNRNSLFSFLCVIKQQCLLSIWQASILQKLQSIPKEQTCNFKTWWCQMLNGVLFGQPEDIIRFEVIIYNLLNSWFYDMIRHALLCNGLKIR